MKGQNKTDFAHASQRWTALRDSALTLCTLGKVQRLGQHWKMSALAEKRSLVSQKSYRKRFLDQICEFLRMLTKDFGCHI